MLKHHVDASEYAELESAIQEQYTGDDESGYTLDVDLDGAPIKTALDEERANAKRYFAKLKAAGIDPDADQKTERERELEQENEALKAKLGEQTETRRRATIEAAVKEAALGRHVHETAIVDVIELARTRFTISEDGRVVTKNADDLPDGLTPDEWLVQLQRKRRHWFPASQGGGAGTYQPPAPEVNPWRATSFDIGAQLDMQSRDPVKAAKLKRLAGR
jgi:hypothetical protein